MRRNHKCLLGFAQQHGLLWLLISLRRSGRALLTPSRWYRTSRGARRPVAAAQSERSHRAEMTALGVEQPCSDRRSTASPRPAFVVGRASRRRRHASCSAWKSRSSTTVPRARLAVVPLERVGGLDFRALQDARRGERDEGHTTKAGPAWCLDDGSSMPSISSASPSASRKGGAGTWHCTSVPNQQRSSVDRRGRRCCR